MSSTGQPQQPMPQPQGGTGAASSPRPMMGQGMQALTQLHQAVELLQKALVGLPMGGEVHTAVMKAITALIKSTDNSSGDDSAKMQQLVGMAREQSSNPQAAMMQKMMGGGGQPQPPAMPGQ